MSVFTPIRIGTFEMPNRLVRSATGEGAAELDVGRPTEAMADFYGKVAAGGVGLVITGHVAVSPEGRCTNRMTALTSDDFVPAFARLVDACHARGRPIVCQLNHGGRQVNPEHRGIEAWCPSPVQAKGAAFVPKELSAARIDRIVEDYGRAAGRAKQAGFDGVQIHSAHGYLGSQFNSPLTNRRTDRWGGTPAKRRRFLQAVYESMRRRVGDEYPILVKQNVSDFHPDGLSEADAVEICKMLDRLGVTAIELSGGIGETIPVAFKAKEARKHEVVFFEREAQAIRLEVACPVIVTGGIRTRTTAERLLAEGICDGVGLCRPMIRQPDLPLRWLSEEIDQADCLSCGSCQSDADHCNFCGVLAKQK